MQCLMQVIEQTLTKNLLLSAISSFDELVGIASSGKNNSHSNKLGRAPPPTILPLNASRVLSLVLGMFRLPFNFFLSIELNVSNYFFKTYSCACRNKCKSDKVNRPCGFYKDVELN